MDAEAIAKARDNLVVWLSSNFDLMVTQHSQCREAVREKLIMAGGWSNDSAKDDQVTVTNGR